MDILRLPVTNEKLMGFHLEFKGTDKIGGERHYFEHMMLNSNTYFTKAEMHRNLSMLGGGLFNACTSQERIMLSGQYLKEDEARVWELLYPIINELKLLPVEIEKERNIILEEFQVGKDNIWGQVAISLGKMLNRPLSIVGSEDSIRGMTEEHLRTAYDDNIVMERATLFVQNCEIGSHIFGLNPVETISLETIVPNENKTTENKNMSSSVAFHTFDVGFSLSALLLEDYLQSAAGPLFRKIREERELCYMVGGMTDFLGDFELSPYFTLYAVSNANIDAASDALIEEFVVDDAEFYESLRKKHTREMELSKATFHGQMALQRRSKLTGIAVDSLIEAIPTWEEFKTYSNNVREKHIGTYKVLGTK